MATSGTRLSVNLNKVALLRNARAVGVPSVEHAAHACLDAGAHGITVHPRPDGRHIRAADVRALRQVTRERGVELNVEGYPSDAFLALVAEARPEQCTLVPDAPAQLTSDHGWDLARDAALLRRVVGRLSAGGTRVSLFMEPEPAPMAAARDLGADRVELYTEHYARAFGTPRRDAVLARYAAAAEAAERAGLGVNAGHDLDLHNLAALRRRLPMLAEVSIGHALVSDALFVGLAAAVGAYLAALADGGRPDSSAR